MTPATRILAEFRKPWLMAPEALQDLHAIAMRARAPEFERAAQIAAERSERIRAADVLTRRRGIAVIPIHGPIFPRSNLFTAISGATSLDLLSAAFRQARADRDIGAIVLDVDSPGGSVTGVSEFAAMVRASKKPVVAFASGMMASAAYWIGSAAHRVAAVDTSWTGSVGAAAMYVIDDDASVVEVVSSQSPLKRTDPRTPEGLAIAQRQVDDLAEVFIDAVAKYRGVSGDFVTANFGRGDVLIGRAAERVGMVDAVGTFEQLLRGMRDAYPVATATVTATAPSAAALRHQEWYMQQSLAAARNSG